MKIVSLWSGPRNVSTALMYSFAQRPDTKVIDEPLYAHYLKNVDVHHPGKKEILQSMEKDGNKVIQDLLHGTFDKDVIFLKNMAHHFVALKEDFLPKFDHVFLIRDPEDMLPSLSIQIKEPVLRDTGFLKQKELYDKLVQLGQNPAVIDSKQLLLNPKEVLNSVCMRLNIPFLEQMLSWKAGSRNEDGVWAKYWYHSVHESTGFKPYETKRSAFPKKLIPLLNECKPLYEYLLSRSTIL